MLYWIRCAPVTCAARRVLSGSSGPWLPAQVERADADADTALAVTWRGRNLCSEPERRRVRALLDWGLTDLGRARSPGPGPYTFWDYRQGAFHRGWGLRIDLAGR